MDKAGPQHRGIMKIGKLMGYLYKINPEKGSFTVEQIPKELRGALGSTTQKGYLKHAGDEYIITSLGRKNFYRYIGDE